MISYLDAEKKLLILEIEANFLKAKGNKVLNVPSRNKKNIDNKLRYHTAQNSGRTIMNDNLGDDFAQFLLDSCTNLLMYCKGAAYICMSSSELHTLYCAFIGAGGKWSTFIIWAKNTFTLGRADYQRQYEPILYGWVNGKPHHWCGDRNQSDVWEYLISCRA